MERSPGWGGDVRVCSPFQQFLDYIAQARELIKPNYERFQISRSFNQTLELPDRIYQADVLLVNFNLLMTNDPHEEPFSGECAFELDSKNRIVTFVICYDEK